MPACRKRRRSLTGASGTGKARDSAGADASGQRHQRRAGKRDFLAVSLSRLPRDLDRKPLLEPRVHLAVGRRCMDDDAADAFAPARRAGAGFRDGADHAVRRLRRRHRRQLRPASGHAGRASGHAAGFGGSRRAGLRRLDQSIPAAGLHTDGRHRHRAQLSGLAGLRPPAGRSGQAATGDRAELHLVQHRALRRPGARRCAHLGVGRFLRLLDQRDKLYRPDRRAAVVAAAAAPDQPPSDPPGRGSGPGVLRDFAAASRSASVLPLIRRCCPRSSATISRAPRSISA